MKEIFKSIAQRYLGMKPEDHNCETYAEMQDKMADVLEDAAISSLRKSFIVFIGENYPEMKNHGGKMNLFELSIALEKYLESQKDN